MELIDQLIRSWHFVLHLLKDLHLELEKSGDFLDTWCWILGGLCILSFYDFSGMLQWFGDYSKLFVGMMCLLHLLHFSKTARWRAIWMK